MAPKDFHIGMGWNHQDIFDTEPCGKCSGFWVRFWNRGRPPKMQWYRQTPPSQYRCATTPGVWRRLLIAALPAPTRWKRAFPRRCLFRVGAPAFTCWGPCLHFHVWKGNCRWMSSSNLQHTCKCESWCRILPGYRCRFWCETSSRYRYAYRCRSTTIYCNYLSTITSCLIIYLSIHTHVYSCSPASCTQAMFKVSGPRLAFSQVVCAKSTLLSSGAMGVFSVFLCPAEPIHEFWCGHWWWCWYGDWWVWVEAVEDLEHCRCIKIARRICAPPSLDQQVTVTTKRKSLEEPARGWPPGVQTLSRPGLGAGLLRGRNGWRKAECRVECTFSKFVLAVLTRHGG